MPNYVLSESADKVVLRNYEGVITTYHEPENYKSDCHCEVCRSKKDVHMVGISGLLNGQKITIENAGEDRKLRVQKYREKNKK